MYAIICILAYEERVAFDRPEYDNAIAIHNSLASYKPRDSLGSASYLSRALEARKLWLQADCNVLTAVCEAVTGEDELLAKFKQNRPLYDKALNQFLDNQMRQRKQRSLQRELDERKLQLDELRETRLKMLADKKSEEEVRVAEKEAARLAKASEPTMANQVGMSGNK